MTHPRVAIRLFTLAFAVIPLACGMRGPPLPPLVIVPAQVSDLSAERFGDEVYLQLTIPSANADRSEPADLERVEVYALTTQPGEDQSQLSGDEWLELAVLVATLEVESPEPDDEREAADGPRYAQGAEVLLVEVLTPELRVPVAVVEEEESDDETLAVDDVPRPGPLLAPPLPQPPRRTYLARAVSTRGRESRPSRRAHVPVGEVPEPPAAPTLSYTADSISIVWSPPPTARLSVEQQQIDGALPSTTLLPPQTPSRYDVYDLSIVEPEPDPDEPDELVDEPDPTPPDAGLEKPTAVNGAPLEALFYSAAAPRFDVERCFALRTVDVADPIDDLLVRGPMSETTCVILVDTFAPPPPTGLVAVATEGAISLTWVASSDSDVTGYVVLRGDPPGETLDPLVADPVTATNFRDTTVEAGQRYVYAVQALDGAMPPNTSTPSVSVVEQAR